MHHVHIHVVPSVSVVSSITIAYSTPSAVPQTLPDWAPDTGSSSPLDTGSSSPDSW